MRRRIYEIIEASKEGDKASLIYDIFMLDTIIISILPLAFKNNYTVFTSTDSLTTAIFIVDYILRLSTADYKLGQKGVFSFIRYPFTLMAVIDLVSIIPTVTIFNSAIRGAQLLRLLKTLRVVRLFKVMRYSKSMRIIMHVIENSKEALGAVVTLAAAYILISALVVFNVEGQSFDTFFDAVYWATVSLTTVGYGDIYPVTTPGRIITMLSSLFGIAVVALPAGIITAGYMEELQEMRERRERAAEIMISVVFEEKSFRSVAYDKEKQVGWCRYENRSGAWVIVETIVDPEYKDHGLGGRLVLCIGENAKKYGIPIISEDPFARNVLSL